MGPERPDAGWDGVFTDFDGTQHYCFVPLEQTDDGMARVDYSRAILPPGYEACPGQSPRPRLRLTNPSTNTSNVSSSVGPNSRASA